MDVPPNILIVDDDLATRQLLLVLFEAEGFVVTEGRSTGSALKDIVISEPDIILLGTESCDQGVVETIRSVRRFSQVPILVTSGQGSDAHIAHVLNQGADDYILKPFNAAVLLARVTANLRLKQQRRADAHLYNGAIAIDTVRHEVRLSGRLVSFTPKEFAMLELFTRFKGRVLTNRQILSAIWGAGHSEDTQYLRVYISQLRQKLRTVSDLGEYLRCEPRIGYCLEIHESDFVPLAAE